VISPDGRSVLFAASVEGAALNIWSLDLERDVATRLTFGESGDFAARWSQDGSQFTFTSLRADGVAQMWVKGAQGTTEPQRLFESDTFQIATSWSPDGRYVMVFELDGDPDLKVLDTESGEMQPYLTSDFAESGGIFSPDGSLVAVVSDESGQDEIYLRPFPLGPGKWRVSTGGAGSPKWSADGRSIFFRGADRKVYQVAVSVEGALVRIGSPRVLFEDIFYRGTGAQYDVMADGSFIFLRLLGEATQGRVLPTLVFNWFEELRRLVPLEK
jgi:Tol biopolymer transport system component